MTDRATWPPNPYDYSAPADSEHFAGRRAEKQVIARFLASLSDTTTGHLLIHGRRGIGKTSLLGELERDADIRGLLTARVTLDATTARDRFFFPEAIRALARAVVVAGGLGGPDGDFARALDLPTISADATAIGPLRVLQFDAVRDSAARIPDTVIHADLTELVDAAREVDRLGLLLTVDEADLLVREEETVQRFRNLLILAGVVSTVAVGTDALVDAVDGQTVPIGRHFRRLELPPLVDLSETGECLSRPLREVGLSRHVLPASVVAEVHSLTGGRPFEVALLGHAMYEDMVARDGEELQLNEPVLDSVIAQVRPSKEDQVALAAFRSLEPDDLRIAARYCVDPSLTVKEHAMLRLAFAPPAVDAVDLSRAEVTAEWRRLAQLHLATDDGLMLTPTFGELSRTYLKYRAHRLGVLEPSTEGRYSDRLASRVQARILTQIPEHTLDVVVYFARGHQLLESGRDPEATRTIEPLLEGSLGEFAAGEGPIPDLPFDFPNSPEVIDGWWAIILLPFEVGEDGFSHGLCLAREGSKVDVDSIEATITKVFGEAESYGIKLGQVDHAIVDAHAWRRLGAARAAIKIGSVAKYLWFRGRRDRALELMQEFGTRLSEDTQSEETLLGPVCAYFNDLAFMEMAAGRMVEAATHFEQIATRGGLMPGTSLEARANLLCNLAATNAGMGRYLEAISWADECIALQPAAADPDLRTGVLAVYVPHPDWPRSPRLVDGPNPFEIAAGTRASAMFQLGQEDAIEAARLVAATATASWGCDVLEAVGKRLGSPELAREAEICRLRVQAEALGRDEDSVEEDGGQE